MSKTFIEGISERSVADHLVVSAVEYMMQEGMQQGMQVIAQSMLLANEPIGKIMRLRVCLKKKFMRLTPNTNR